MQVFDKRESDDALTVGLVNRIHTYDCNDSSSSSVSEAEILGTCM